jgi:hypothetical protein
MMNNEVTDVKVKRITAFTASRPTTNLNPDPKFQLTKAQLKSGFMGVFNWTYSGDPRRTLMKIALGAIMDTAQITMGKEPRATSQEERAARKMKQKALREYDEQRQSLHLAHHTILKKVNGDDPHFELLLPVLHFNSPSSLTTITSLFGSGEPSSDSVAELNNFFQSPGTHRVDPRVALQRSRLGKDVQDLFSQSLKGVVFKGGEGLVIAYLQFTISKLEAEALVSTDWLEIRPVDVYPLFSMWVEAEFVSKFYGKSAISLSKIAKTLPPHTVEDRRTDQYGISIGMDGMPAYLPADCDNTDKYESMFATVGSREDGTFSLMSVDERHKTPNLPANIPILVDWVNLKFTYSNTGGRPVVMPLEHMRKCTPSMAVNILNRPLPAKMIDRLAGYARVANLSSTLNYPSPKPSAEEMTRLSPLFRQQPTIGIQEYFQRINLTYNDIEIRYRDLVDGEDIIFAPVREWIMKLVPAIQNNIEALYSVYAVSTMLDVQGILSVMLYYGIPMGETEAVANRDKKAALEQGIDPNWTPPEMPLITSKFSQEDSGLLPHQAKVRNLLRDSPDYAILSVDAGGGKSMLSITDILYEIKQHRSAPYLIMCPGHLVANYVSELVEFTDGKVNVIPITSHVIRTSGYARLTQILEKAPINTVMVVDYGALKFRARSAVYGTSSVLIFPVVELIRQFRPGYAMLDESHLLKNAQSATFKSVMNLIADVPKKRIASGTLNPDSPSDLPSQVAIMDPTVFGTREDFNNTYGEVVSGGRVMKWQQSGPNSVSTVMAKLKRNVVWCQAKRKEWACALPRRRDHFIPVQLTDRQREVYDAIFEDMVQQIRKAAQTDKNAQKLLDSLEGKKASAGDEEDFGDMGESSEEDLIDDSQDIGPGLQPYLVDIERFVTNPAFHPYAKNGFVTADGEHIAPLTGDDLIPPKALMLKKLMLEEYDVLNPNVGKVLVFVNYNESATSVFNAMPPELQACGILYSTANKTELVNKFKKDPKIRWMIGIRKSLEVGLNLQVASVLVRLEGVWTPGEQEQGDSRIARPYFGPGGDQRPFLRFDTIVADRTIDITKAARLRAKIVALAKFENTGDPNYEALEDIPIIPMRLEAIQTMNDFNTNLAQYASTMKQLNQVITKENDEHKAKMEAEDGFHFTQIKTGPVPEGCALLARVPYAQGTELYKASELGLVRVDNYLGLELAADEEEGGDEGEEDSVETDDQKRLRAAILGMTCHTESGDGVIKSLAFKKGMPNYVIVALDDGTTVIAKTTSAFIVTRTETNSIDMRNKLIQAAGLSATADITVPAANTKQTRITLKEQREIERRKEQEIKERQRKSLSEKKEAKLSISLQLNVVNGYLQVGFIPDKSEKAARALEALGFKQNPSYYYTRIRTYKHLINQATIWANAGFEVNDKYDSGALAALSVALTQNGLQSHRHYTNLMGAAQFRNYMRDAFKPTADKKLLNIFALVTDGGWSDPLNLKRAQKAADEEGTEVTPAYGIAYLCLPAGGGHPGSRLAIQPKFAAPVTRWHLSQPMLTKFVGSIKGVHAVIQELRDAGININNVEQLNEYARSVKRVAPKVDESVFKVGDEEAEVQPKTRRVKTPSVPERQSRKAPPAGKSTRQPVKVRDPKAKRVR